MSITLELSELKKIVINAYKIYIHQKNRVTNDSDKNTSKNVTT